METDAEPDERVSIRDDKYDAVIFHSEEETEQAKRVRDIIKTIPVEGKKELKVEIFDDLQHPGKSEIDNLDHILENTTFIMFFRTELFFRERMNRFSVGAALTDRITHLDPKRHWTVIPLDFNKTEDIAKLKPSVKTLGGLTICSNGELDETRLTKLGNLLRKKLQHVSSSASISSLGENRTEEGQHQNKEATAPATRNEDQEYEELERRLKNLQSPSEDNAIDNFDDQPEMVDKNKCYRMDSFPRGYFLIINNEHFKKDHRKELDDRTGTYYDKKLMIETFLHLGFEIQALDDLTAEEMIGIIRTFGKRDHARYDCFACCILTHGGNSGNVYGVDGLPVNIEEIEDSFRSTCCPSLAGKPKLFFIQACRGVREQGGDISKLQADAPSTDCQSKIKTDAPPTGENPPIPDKADFFVGFSTVNGHKSFREEEDGSWFIRNLATYLREHAHKDDIHTIFVYINEAVSKLSKRYKDGECYIQVCEHRSSLKHKLLFPRSNK